MSIAQLESRLDVRTVAGLSNDTGQVDVRIDANVEACIDDAASYIRGRTERYLDWINIATWSTGTKYQVLMLQLKLTVYNLFLRRGKAPEWVDNLKKQVDDFLGGIEDGKFSFVRADMKSSVFPVISPDTEEGVFHGQDSYSSPFFPDPADDARGWGADF